MSRIYKLPLKTGGYTLVDHKDYNWFKRWGWTTARAKNTKYVRQSGGDNTSLHRLIVGAQSGQVVDHINGDGLDNRRSNLRICTQIENVRNRAKHKKGTSQYKGVSFFYRGKKNDLWQARIRIGKKTATIGLFKIEIEAARAYDRAAELWFGDFAKLNFPEETLL